MTRVTENKAEIYCLDKMEDVLKHLEKCGRNCYVSGEKITDTSAPNFITGVLRSGHESVIEHAHFIFKMPCESAVKLFNILDADTLTSLRGINVTKHLTFTNEGKAADLSYIISGNPRAFRDIYRDTGYYIFLDKLPEVFSFGIPDEKRVPLVNPNEYELVGVNTSIYGPKHNYFTFRYDTDIGCYDDKTLVLTQKGWKYIKDVTREDKVYTKDNYDKVLLSDIDFLIEKDYKGELYNYKSNLIDLAVTPDHNMWVFDSYAENPKDRAWKFLTTESMTNKGYKFDKLTNREYTVSERTIDIPDFQYSKKDWVREGKSINNIKFFELMGYYVMNGYSGIKRYDKWRNIVRKDKRKHRLGFYAPNKQIRIKINSLLDELNIEHTDCTIDDVAVFEFMVSMYPKDYDDGTYDPLSVPDFIKNGASNEIEAFLEACLKAGGREGYTDGRRIIYAYHQQFAFDLMELCFKCGKSVDYTINKKPYEKYDPQPFYCVNINSSCCDSFVVNEKSVTKAPYEGKVYCLGLKEHHKLFVQREGKTCWCGNCYKDATRHRNLSWSIESTRYCSYNKDKFNNEIKIADCSSFMSEEVHKLYLEAMASMEKYYMKMAEAGAKADMLRMVLPHGTQASVVMSGSVYDLEKMFNLRCDSHAHPSVQSTMKNLRELMHQHFQVDSFKNKS